jgi:hypothetical protein
MTGINHTPTYRDPFWNKPLMPRGGLEAQRGLEKLLDYYGIREDAAVTLAVHLISPVVVYENYGKSAISDEPYREFLTDLVATVVEQYQEATRPADPVDYLSEPAHASLPKVIRLLGGTVFSENQLISAVKRHLRLRADELVAADLAKPTADDRLRAVLRTYQQKQPIRGLFQKQKGRLAVPRHPADSITVGYAGQNLVDLLDQYQVRAVLVTNRPELEELLLGLEIPLRYDAAIMRSDGDLMSSLESLTKSMAIPTARAAVTGVQPVLPIWVARDATLEGATLVSRIRELLRQHHVADQRVVDLGLLVGDEALQESWVEVAVDAPTADVEALRAAGLGAPDLAFYMEQHASARLDSLEPRALIAWFERRLAEIGVPQKSIPDATSLGAVAVEQLSERLRSLVDRFVLEKYRLDNTVSQVITTWKDEFPNWETRLHGELTQALRDNARQSWRSILDYVVDQMVQQYLTPQRVAEIRASIKRIGSEP